MTNDSWGPGPDGGHRPGAVPPPGADQPPLDSPWGQRPAASPFGGQAGGPPPAQDPHGQSPYGPSQPPHGPNPYGQSPYGQSPYGQSPYGQSPYGQSPYGPNPYGPQQGGEPPFGPFQQGGPNRIHYGVPLYRRQSQATAALVLSIVGFFFCGIPAVIGAVMGKTEMSAIDRGETDPANRGTAVAALIIGLISIGLVVVPFMIYLAMLVFFGASAIAL